MKLKGLFFLFCAGTLINIHELASMEQEQKPKRRGRPPKNQMVKTIASTKPTQNIQDLANLVYKSNCKVLNKIDKVNERLAAIEQLLRTHNISETLPLLESDHLKLDFESWEPQSSQENNLSDTESGNMPAFVDLFQVEAPKDQDEI